LGVPGETPVCGIVVAANYVVTRQLEFLPRL